MAPLAIAVAALEAAAGALVFALLSVIADPAGDSRLVDYLRTLVPGGEPAAAVWLAACAAGVHILKNLVVVLFAWWRSRAAAYDSAALATRLLRAYMHAPWPFHVARGSAVAMENLREGPRPFFGVFESAAIVATEAAVVAALSTVSILAAPFAVTAIALGLTIAVLAVVRMTRRAQQRGGARQFALGAALYRHVQHGLGAVKELRILGRTPFFVEAFHRDAIETARLDTSRATLDAVPRVLLETLFALGLLALIFSGADAAGDSPSILPLATLYAYIGFRVVPAAQRIVQQINSIRWSLAATAPLAADIRRLERDGEVDSPVPPRLPFHDRIRVESVAFAYEPGAPILSGVSFSIRCGESVAIVGRTGAGKTTLVDLLLGFLQPTTGTITVDGAPVAQMLAAWHQNIGYVPQTPFLLDDTVLHNVAIGVPDDRIDRAAVGRAIRSACLEPWVAALPAGLDSEIGERGVRLSGGERQRLAIARALYREASVIVLDEATSSLDPATERDVAEAIAALHGDVTLIVIAHRLTTVARCDRVLFLNGGCIEASGSYAELAAGNAAFRAVAALG